MSTESNESNDTQVSALTGPYSQFLLHTATPLGLIEDGHGDFTMADIDRDGRPDMVFIKRRDTGTGTIEVHAFSGASGFQTSILNSGSALSQDEDSFGSFAIADADGDGRPDLIFIKRRATGTGTIEVHIFSAASGFKQAILNSGSGLSETEDTSGDFTMADVDRDGRPDLVFIKRRATGSGTMEIHVASAASGFQQFLLHAAIPLTLAEDGLGEFTMADVDRDGRPDLVYVKVQSTGSGTVEIHVLSAASGFQLFAQHAVTALVASEGAFGTFSMTDHNLDGLLDLDFFKRRKTGSGTIEVHILGG